MYSAIGWTHARLSRAIDDFRSSHGQGTVEYVALVLVIALVMAGVVTAMKGFKTNQSQGLGDSILGKIKDAIAKIVF